MNIPLIHQYALRLCLAHGLGNMRIAKLLKNFGHISAIFNATDQALLEHLLPKHLEILKNTQQALQDYLPKHIQFLADSQHAFITWDDGFYPESLRQAYDAPCALYVKGNIQLLKNLAIGIVGSRDASVYGLKYAAQFSKKLAEYGFTIVSGMAAGIDHAAHEAALTEKGSTIGVLGTGIDIIYPRQNQPLFTKMAQNACIISEFLLGSPPTKHSFPIRNRSIAALAKGVLIIEAGLRSGSLITARLANEMGRDVFVLPHCVDQPQAAGGNALIKQGAQLVDDVTDILQSYGLFEVAEISDISDVSKNSLNENNKPQKSTLSKKKSEASTQFSLLDNQQNQQTQKIYTCVIQEAIMQLLTMDSMKLDDLIEKIAYAPEEIQTQLFMLELDNDIVRLPGGQYRKI